MDTLKVIKIGNSAGALLPKELLTKLNVRVGDPIYVTEAPNGEMRLTANDPDFERQMKIAEDVMRTDRDILRALSK